MSAVSSNRSISAWNFCSRSVIGVAITTTLGCPPDSAAGFSAGSMPITGISRYMARRSFTAALVAVLHASATAFAPCSTMREMWPMVSARTSSSVRVP